MSGHATYAGKRFRVSAALLVLALAVAVVVLTTQARSIWSERNESQVRQGHGIVVPSTNVGLVNSGDMGAHCRPKFGCQNDAGTGEKP